METNNVGAVRATEGSPALGGETPTIEERVEKLEREAGHWRRLAMRLYGVSLALGAMLVVILALAATKTAATTQDHIRAKQIDIVDDKGNYRAGIGPYPGGYALWVLDEKQKMRAWLGVSSNGPYLTLHDSKGRTRAWVGVNSVGPGLAMIDDMEIKRAEISVDAGGPQMEMFDGKGNLRVGLAVAETYGPGLQMADDKGKVIWHAPEE